MLYQTAVFKYISKLVSVKANHEKLHMQFFYTAKVIAVIIIFLLSNFLGNSVALAANSSSYGYYKSVNPTPGATKLPTATPTPLEPLNLSINTIK